MVHFVTFRFAGHRNAVELQPVAGFGWLLLRQPGTGPGGYGQPDGSRQQIALGVLEFILRLIHGNYPR